MLFFNTITSFLRNREYRDLLYTTTIILIVGTISYHYIEGWSLVNSLYFSVITLTTIGYGDFSPQTDLGKMFTIVYILMGLGIILQFINTVKNHYSETRNKHHHKKENRVIALTNYPISLGKVAAVAFLFLSIIAWQFFNSNTDDRIVYITKTDTLVKEKEIPVTEVIHDTFLVHTTQPKTPNKAKNNIVSFSSTPTMTDIYIAGTDEMEKTYNRPKNNSLKNDTLVHKYGFVSL